MLLSRALIVVIAGALAVVGCGSDDPGVRDGSTATSSRTPVPNTRPSAPDSPGSSNAAIPEPLPTAIAGSATPESGEPVSLAEGAVAGKEQEYDTFVGWWNSGGSILLTTLDILDPIALSTGLVIPGAAAPPATISPKERCGLVSERLPEIEESLLPGPTEASDGALRLGFEHLGNGLSACLAAGDETSAALGFSAEYETAHRNLLASVIGLAAAAGLEPEQIPSPPGYVAPTTGEVVPTG